MIHYYEESAEHATEKSVSLRECFSSRHYPYIVIRRGVRLTLEDEDGHSKDLQKYVASRLRTEDALSVEARLFMWGGDVVFGSMSIKFPDKGHCVDSWWFDTRFVQLIKGRS